MKIVFIFVVKLRLQSLLHHETTVDTCLLTKIQVGLRPLATRISSSRLSKEDIIYMKSTAKRKTLGLFIGCLMRIISVLGCKYLLYSLSGPIQDFFNDERLIATNDVLSKASFFLC